jgi:type VI protein secretion system component VasK
MGRDDEGRAAMEWFWHVLLICLVVIPAAIMWLAVIFELFRRGDLKWWQRLAWFLLVIVFPLIGSIIFLGYTWVTAGRRAPEVASGLPRFDAQSSSAPDVEADLSSLERLRQSGVITGAEFEAGKRQVLEGIPAGGVPTSTQAGDEMQQAPATEREPKHGAP